MCYEQPISPPHMGQGRSKEIIIAVSEKLIQILTDDIQSLWRQYQNLHPSWWSTGSTWGDSARAGRFLWAISKSWKSVRLASESPSVLNGLNDGLMVGPLGWLSYLRMVAERHPTQHHQPSISSWPNVKSICSSFFKTCLIELLLSCYVICWHTVVFIAKGKLVKTRVHL